MKYIIEIENEFKDSYGNKLYKAKSFNSLVFDQNGLDKLEKYEAFQTYNKGYQQGYEDARKRFDPMYFEPGDIVEDKEGNKFAFVNIDSNGEYYRFSRLGYPVSKLFGRSYLIENKFVKTGEKADLIYMDNKLSYVSYCCNYCCCDKREV